MGGFGTRHRAGVSGAGKGERVRNWRVLTAIAAVVLAALAGVLVWQYVDDADDRAEEDQDLVEVYIAESVIPRGVSFTDALANEQIAVGEIRREDLDRTPTAVLPEQEAAMETLIAAGTIGAGQTIVREQFVERGQALGTAGLIDEGMMAITVNVDETHGVAGFVTPGDRVNLILSLGIEPKVLDPNAPRPSGEGADIETIDTTAFLIPGLEVLGVGKTTSVGTQQTAPSTDTNGDGKIDANDEAPDAPPQQTGLITVIATPRQAAQIAHAQQVQGQIYVVLNPPDFDPATFQDPGEIVEAINLFDQPLELVDQVIAQLAQQP